VYARSQVSNLFATLAVINRRYGIRFVLLALRFNALTLER
jgi:hypothetical protein